MDATTAASLATAAGTLVLAVATFASVRSSNRSARLAEYSMQIGIRPLLMPSRLEDAPQKIRWGDDHRASLAGSGAHVEIVDGNIYLAMSVRNAGSGIAVLHGWHVRIEALLTEHGHAERDEFRPQQRDLYIPGGDVGFWQAAIRDPEDLDYRGLRERIQARDVFLIELLYTDHQGEQPSITLLVVNPLDGGEGWSCAAVRHWNLDRPDPR
jgi:hypothetical protein